jgi:hypothetical protein
MKVGSRRLLMLRIALALLNDARRHGTFESDAKALATRTAELEAEFTEGGSDHSSDPEITIQAIPLTSNEINLSIASEDLVSRFVSLRLDGLLHEGGVSISVSLDAVSGAEELSPSELAQLTQPSAELDIPPRFRGDRLLRTIAAPQQPDSEIQILATELFDDGLIVHISFNRETDSLEAAGSGGPPWGSELTLSVEDDLGTEYHGIIESESGGEQVAHESVVFVPAIPATARVLHVISRSGTVELAL